MPVACRARVNTAWSELLSNPPGIPKSELISYVTREAKVAPTTAARVIDVLRAADLLDPIPGDGPAPERKGGRKAKRPRLTETEIRAKLIAGFDAVKGMEIEDVFGRLR